MDFLYILTPASNNSYSYALESFSMSLSLRSEYDIPFVPSSDDRLFTMLELAAIKPGYRVADLGSGDGKIILAMAKLGAEAHGFEIDPGRVNLTQKKIEEELLENKAFIHHQDLWGVDVSNFDIVTIYGITSIMKRLEEKLKREIKNSCRVLSNGFTFPTWPHVFEKNHIYVYSKF